MSAEPLIDVTSSESATRLGVEAVEGLPNNGRNFLNFTKLTPGVGHRAGPGRRRAHHQRPEGHPQQRLGGRRRLQQPVLRRAARRPAAGVHVQPRRGAGGRGRGRRRQRRVRPVERRVRQRHHQVGHQRVPRVGALLRQERRALGRLLPHASRAAARPDSPPTSRSTSSAPRSAGRSCGTRCSSSSPTTSRSTTTKQTDRLAAIEPRSSPSPTPRSAGRCRARTARSRGPTTPTRCSAKLDFRLSQKHSATLKYNYTWSEQQNGTFDVDSWGRSANALETGPLERGQRQPDLAVLLRRCPTSSGSSVAREDRPRPYDGPDQPGHRAPLSRHRHRLRRPGGFSVPLRHAVLHSGADRVRLPVPGARQRLASSGATTSSRSASSTTGPA